MEIKADKNLKDDFFKWAHISLAEKNIKWVEQNILSVENYAKRVRMISCSIFEVGNIEILYKILKKISADKVFRIKHQKFINVIIDDFSSYIRFVTEYNEKSTDKEEPENAIDEAEAKDDLEQAEDDNPVRNISPDWIKFDYRNPKDFMKTEPAYVSIGGHEIKAKKWAGILFNLTEWELENNSDLMDSLTDKPLKGKSGRPFLMQDRVYGLTCQQLSNGYWLNLNYSIPQLIKIIVELCMYCGYTRDEIIIYGAKKSSNESAAYSRNRAKGEQASLFDYDDIDGKDYDKYREILAEKFKKGFRDGVIDIGKFKKILAGNVWRGKQTRRREYLL